MAEKGFGVKEIDFIGSSPKITSPSNLNLNAVNVAISTNVSIGAGLTVAGISTFNKSVHIPDAVASNDYASLYLGTGDDVRFFHNGTHTFWQHKLGTPSNGGSLYIDSYTSTYMRTSDGSNNVENAIVMNSNDSVDLYHSGSKKLETKSTGINVTGAITVNNSALSIDPTNSDIQVVYTVTANGSSAYRFAGNGVVSTADDPDLYLIRGQKYRFINNSGGSHPFQIREASGGTAYSTGVTNNGAASGNIDFAPTFDSPAQLVYQCTSHGGMVGNIYLKDGNGNETNVGVTTFSGLVHLNQLKKISGTLDYLAATHNFANAAGSTNYFTVNNTDATLTGSTDGVLNLDTTDARGSFIRFKENGTSKCFVGCGEGLSLGDQDDLGLRATDNIIFRAGSSESMRIRSSTGGLMIGDNGSTRIGEPKLHVLNGGASNNVASFFFNTTDNRQAVFIRHNGADGGNNRTMLSLLNADGNAVGNIISNGSSTSYNTSSDYRLKENVTAISDGITRLKTLKPYRFNFKVDTDTTVDGFLAHEVTAVPEAISGTKDEVDSDNKPVYQGIDQSKLVPLLTAALQEAIAKIETLETEVAALKAK